MTRTFESVCNEYRQLFPMLNDGGYDMLCAIAQENAYADWSDDFDDIDNPAFLELFEASLEPFKDQDLRAHLHDFHFVD